MADRLELERALLSDPFNMELRCRYADLLLQAGDATEALAQFELLRRQDGTDARASVGAALALLRLGREEEARSAYLVARGNKGFVPDPALESLAGAAGRQGAPRLTVLTGGREPSSNVVDLATVGRERISFDDIAGLDELKRTIRLQIVEPFLRPSLFARFKKKAGGGVMLYGPPGCGKTMIARAIATECRAEFLSVGISDVLNMYIGESERNLAALFDKARKARPCVMFFDEIDALAYARSKAQSEHTRQIVNEFLAQLDGIDNDNQGVLILAATNMPWDVDSAMKRPGRFARQVFVPPPDPSARAHIVRLKLRGLPHDAIDPAAVAAVTQHYSGADIDGLVEAAKDFVLEAHVQGRDDRVLTQEDLLEAAKELRPSTLDWLRTAYNLVKYAGADDSYRDVEKYLSTHRIK